jgi:hypothetical protein
MSLTTRLRIVLVVLAAVLALAGVSAAAASPPGTHGTFTTTSTSFANIRMVGDDTYIENTATIAYTGTFSGTSTVRGNLIFHPDGSAIFFDIETFTGTVNGIPSVVTFYLSGGGNITTGTYEGTQEIVNASGALANLHGKISQVGKVVDKDKGPFGTYTGQLRAHGRGWDE